MRTKKRFILPYLTISLFVLLTLTNTFAPVGIDSTAHAATYYVDVTNGNDPNDGLSPETAWKTISTVNNEIFFPGDSILFKRGEIWREMLRVSSSGEEGTPITFGAYGEGEKPIISGRKTITGWDNTDNWTYNGDNVWYMSRAHTPERLWLDGVEILRADTIEHIDGTQYKWLWENSFLYVYSTQNPANEYNSIEGNVFYDTMKICGRSYINVQGIDIQGGWGYSLAIRGADHIKVTNCNCGLYAHRAIQIRDHSGIPSRNITIDNCLVDSGFNFSYGPPSTRGVGDGFKICRGAQDCIIKNNIIRDWGHSGIYCIATTQGDPGVCNNKIYNNLITGEHVSYMRGIGTDGLEGKCQNNEFYNNIIKNTTVRNQINGNNNWIHYNIIDTVTNSPCKSGGTAQGFDLQGYDANRVCHDNKIDNNIILNCEEAGIRLHTGTNNKVNNYIRNNIIYNCGTNSKNGFNDYGIVIDSHSSIKGNIFENNCVYSGDVNNVIYYRGTIMTVEEFNSQDGNYDDIIDVNIQADPLFVDASNHDFHLQPFSPCIDLGMHVGLIEDFEGNPVDSVPDIGADEYVNIR